MTKEGFSRQFGRMDKQLHRLEDRLVPPKETEAVRHLRERIEEGRQMANMERASRGLAPLPEPPEWVTPLEMRRGSIEEHMAIINAGRTRSADEQEKREAEVQTPGA